MGIWVAKRWWEQEELDLEGAIVAEAAVEYEGEGGDKWGERRRYRQ